MIIQIKSSEKGKQCDLFPFNSIHEVKIDENGLISKNIGNRIPLNFKTEELSGTMITKICSDCNNVFPEDHMFVESGQKNDHLRCTRCHERKYVIGRESYKEALRIEIFNELNIEKIKIW